ncbi:MAG TPA: retropepsin-like aspartic protease [Candidatus Paceibacterota bacterium]
MKYKYFTVSEVFDTQGRHTKRPIVEVELVNQKMGEKDYPAFALIDSGADTTMMNIAYAQLLGVKTVPHRSGVVGISGAPSACYFGHVSFKIKDLDGKVDLPVLFIDSPNVDVLLGQEKFFDIFKIKFEKDHDTFEITPVKK